jgi:surfactin synthase thioesterase subunit
MKKINLICIPFAGGSEHSYRAYQKKVSDFFTVKVVSLPGRGSRMKEKLLFNLDALVDDVYAQIQFELDSPYALYGHSMGALIAYLLAVKIQRAGQTRPLNLFLTGAKSPTERAGDVSRHLLPKDRFIAELRLLGGCPEEMLNDEEMLNLFEPILRADFQAVESYKLVELAIIDVPLTVIVGSAERFSYSEASAWSKVCTCECHTLQLPGGHFFIFDHVEAILKTIAEKLYLSMVRQT